MKSSTLCSFDHLFTIWEYPNGPVSFDYCKARNTRALDKHVLQITAYSDSGDILSQTNYYFSSMVDLLCESEYRKRSYVSELPLRLHNKYLHS